MFGQSIRAGEIQEVMDAARKSPRSYVAQVVSAGLAEYDGGRQTGSEAGDTMELVKGALDHVENHRLAASLHAFQHTSKS